MSLCKDSQNLLQATTKKVFNVQVNVHIGILEENKIRGGYFVVTCCNQDNQINHDRITLYTVALKVLLDITFLHCLQI